MKTTEELIRETDSEPELWKPIYIDLGEVLVKADEKNPYIVYLEASNERVDYDKEVVFTKALEDAKEHFLKVGVISWDHLHKSEKKPEYIIGEPLDVKFKDQVTWVKSFLYKGCDYADSVVKLIKGGCKKLSASVGGFIKERKKLGKSVSGITKVIWDEVAITYKAKNIGTTGSISLTPIGAFVKALVAGSGVDASKMTGGRAITPESLRGSVVKVEQMMREFNWRVGQGDIRTDQDLKDFLDYHGVPHLYGMLAKKLINKFNNLKND